MKRPNAASLAVLMLAVCAMCGSRLLGTRRTTIDRAFLDPLATIPVERPLSEDEDIRYGNLVWSNAEELRYLARTGDPLAVRCVVRLIVRGGPPGACSCTAGEFDDCAFTLDAMPAIWPALHDLATPHQVEILTRGDAMPWFDGDDEVWEAQRERHLAGRPGLAAAYLAACRRTARDPAGRDTP